MARSAAAAAQFTPSPAIRPQLRAPTDLDAIEREVFADLLIGSPPGQLLPCDEWSLGHLARNIVLMRVAFGEMKAAGFVGAKAAEWARHFKEAGKEARATARMLGLTPTSYRQPVKPDEDLQVSYYERQRLLEARPDDRPEPN